MGNGDLILPSLDLFYIYLGFHFHARLWSHDSHLSDTKYITSSHRVGLDTIFTQ